MKSIKYPLIPGMYNIKHSKITNQQNNKKDKFLSCFLKNGLKEIENKYEIIHDKINMNIIVIDVIISILYQKESFFNINLLREK